MPTVISYQLRTPLSDLSHLDTATANRHIEEQPLCSQASGKSPKSVCRHNVEELPASPCLRKKTTLLLDESEESRRSNVLTRLSSRYARRRSSNSDTLVEHVQAANDNSAELKKLQEENEFRHLLAVQEGRDFLHHFAKTHFESHMDHISITNTKSIGEIKMIGNEELSVGVRQCRRLFNAPVISDDMGLLLWQELRQGNALDHSHEETAATADVAPEELRRQRMAEFEERKAAWHEYQLSRAEQDIEVCEILRNRYGYTYANAPAEVTRKQGQATMGRPAPTKEAYALGSLPMERRALDGFLNEVKKRTTRGAGVLAASMVAGYEHP